MLKPESVERPGHTGPLPLHNLEADLPFAIGSFDGIGPLSRADFPHRHTFYEIVYVTSGAGGHVIDLSARPLQPPQMHVVFPGQVHFWQRTAGLDGYVILFTGEFLSAYPGDREVLRRLADRPLGQLSPGDDDDLSAVVTAMRQEYEQRSADFVPVLQAYLHILILRAARLPACPMAYIPPHRAALVAREFSVLLTEWTGTRLTVQRCARHLRVSQTYLNEVVRAVTGHTPAQMIRQAEVLEAKRLLTRTGLTVAQIAKELGFPDPAYFCRFFRRETEQSPGEFRRTADGIHHLHPPHSIDGQH